MYLFLNNIFDNFLNFVIHFVVWTAFHYSLRVLEIYNIDNMNYRFRTCSGSE